MTTSASSQTMAAIKTFVEEELLAGRNEKFDEKTDLLEQGVIDSLSLLRLVTFLEENCRIVVPDEEMVPENFRSLAAIQAFVARRQEAAGSQSS